MNVAATWYRAWGPQSTSQIFRKLLKTCQSWILGLVTCWQRMILLTVLPFLRSSILKMLIWTRRAKAKIEQLNTARTEAVLKSKVGWKTSVWISSRSDMFIMSSLMQKPPKLKKILRKFLEMFVCQLTTQLDGNPILYVGWCWNADVVRRGELYF